MSPEAVRTFRPAPLAVAPAAELPGARAAGYAAGWAAGSRAAAEQTADLQLRLVAQHERAESARTAATAAALATLERAARTAAARTAPVLDQAHAALLSAALELAGAVLQRELTPGPDAARSVMERALAVPAELGTHTVRLCPADLHEVQALLAAGELTVPDGVRLVADAQLRPGDAVSAYPHGYLDARISTAMDRARRALLEDVAPGATSAAAPQDAR